VAPIPNLSLRVARPERHGDAFVSFRERRRSWPESRPEAEGKLFYAADVTQVGVSPAPEPERAVRFRVSGAS
jgi:hypothetical protein